MKTFRLLSCLSLGAMLFSAAPWATARAMPASGNTGLSPPPGVTEVQYSNSKSFRSCMRQKYGPKYFRGVKRAHRYHMAQACGG
jgi:hypothetical protein